MNISILGFGTVGRGIDVIVEKQVDGVRVARILELPDRLTDPRMTSNFDDILNDDSIEVVAECMGGIEPAHTYILAALSRGKSVVTSNKAVVAAHFSEFARVAGENGASLLIEASVGGGIPWIASVEKVRRVDEVSSISGIMNGTTNYVIDAMEKDGAEFGDVLARAQKLGYAERDPAADIDGIDVRNKTIISVGVAFDTACRADIPTTGIRTLTRQDLEALHGEGFSLRVLGRAVQDGSSYAAAVEPVALPLDSLEAHVPLNFNLISLDATTVGPLKFYGQGAGMLPTGNAMVQDVLDFAAGRRPTYRLSRNLAWNPGLLAGDYLFRTTAPVLDAKPLAGGMCLVEGIDPVHARELLDQALEKDPGTFMCAVSPKD